MLSPHPRIRFSRVGHHRRSTLRDRHLYITISIRSVTAHRDKHIPAPHAPRVISNAIDLNRRATALNRIDPRTPRPQIHISVIQADTAPLSHKSTPEQPDPHPQSPPAPSSQPPAPVPEPTHPPPPAPVAPPNPPAPPHSAAPHLQTTAPAPAAWHPRPPRPAPPPSPQPSRQLGLSRHHSPPPCPTPS